MVFYRRRQYDGSSDIPSHSDETSLITLSNPNRNADRPYSRPYDHALLELCDVVRESLVKKRSLGSRAKEIMTYLQDLLEDESLGHSLLDFNVLRKARLDKLLVDILSKGNRPDPTPIQFRADMSTAASLQRRWRTRFGAQYFEVDQTRYANLTKTGRLRDVVYNGGASREQWQTKASKDVPELESDLRFEAGNWWLNLACAYRDGIVGTAGETPTKGRFGNSALPLMTGQEELHWPGETVRYIKEGKISDMHVTLLSQVGFPLRILRGHCLKSPQAPKAGVRYDGLYIIRQYSQRQNQQTGFHRMELTLERVNGQRPMQEVINIPRASQLDDWKLYEKHEGEMVKQRGDDRDFLDWKMAKAQERMDLEQWQRTMHLELELNLAKMSKDKDIDNMSMSGVAGAKGKGPARRK